MEERSVHLTPPPSPKKIRFFPRAIKTRCVRDYLTSIITSPRRTTLAPPTCIIIRPALPPQTQPPQQQPFNSGKRGLRGTGYPPLTRRRVSIRKGPASRRVRLYNFCPGAERARRARKLGHFHHTSQQQQLGLALWPPSAFSKVVDGQGECLRFFLGGPEYDITSLALSRASESGTTTRPESESGRAAQLHAIFRHEL